MSTATTTEPSAGQSISHLPQSQSQSFSHNSSHSASQTSNQSERSAAQRLRTTMAAVKLAFTWLGVRKTLAPEQRSTAARAFQADLEFLSASKLVLDTKNPTYRNVARVRSEVAGYWRTVTLPFPEPGVRLLNQNLLGQFASTMQTYREKIQEAARDLAGEYELLKIEAQQRLGALFNPSDYPSTLDGLFDLEVSYPTIDPPG